MISHCKNLAWKPLHLIQSLKFVIGCQLVIEYICFFKLLVLSRLFALIGFRWIVSLVTGWLKIAQYASMVILHHLISLVQKPYVLSSSICEHFLCVNIVTEQLVLRQLALGVENTSYDSMILRKENELCEFLGVILIHINVCLWNYHYSSNELANLDVFLDRYTNTELLVIAQPRKSPL